MYLTLLHAAMNHANQQMNNFGQRQLCDRTNAPQVGHCGRIYVPDDARVNRSKDRSVNAAEIEAGRRSAGAGGAHAEPASSTYARLASEAEAVAKSTGSELFVALPAMRKDWEHGSQLFRERHINHPAIRSQRPLGRRSGLSDLWFVTRTASSISLSYKVFLGRPARDALEKEAADKLHANMFALVQTR